MDTKKQIVRRFIEEMVNTGQTGELASLIADEYIDLYSKSNNLRGPEMARAHIEAVRSTYQDLHVEVLQQFCDGDTVITLFIATATHRGEWLNILPTNKRIEIEGVNIDTVVNGKIISHTGFANTFEALVKIGALPGVGISG